MAQILRFNRSDITSFFRNYGSQRCNANHYDTLCISKNCTQQEIRKAFLKLSKKTHPDVSGKEGHVDFVKLCDAYNVLNKVHTRREYDSHLNNCASHTTTGAKVHPYYYYRSRREWEEHATAGAWSSYPFSEYGPVQDRTHSLKVFLLTLVVIVIASFLQIIIKRKAIKHREYMSRVYRDVREHKRKIKMLNREEQMKIFSNKLNKYNCEIANETK